MAAKTRTRTLTIRPCECAGWAIVETSDTDAAPTIVRRTGCTATTCKTFAPGHDAKLKGLLIEAGACGHQVMDPHGRIQDPATAARQFGFHPQVLAGIDNLQAKKQTRKTRKPRARRVTVEEMIDQALPLAPIPVVVLPVEPVQPDTERDVTIRHGRWTYTGAEVRSDGTATYTDRRGNPVTVAAGRWHRVTEG